MNAPKTEYEMCDLIARLCDGHATPDEQRWLRDRMNQDEPTRWLYLECMTAEAAIARHVQEPAKTPAGRRKSLVDFPQLFAEAAAHQRAGIELTTETHAPQSIANRLADSIHWRRHPIRFVAFSGLLTALMVAAWVSIVQPRPFQAVASRPSDSVAAPQFVARLVHSAHVAWQDPQTAPLEGAFLRSGQNLELKDGLAIVEFGGGARIALRGPSKLRLVDANRGWLETGTLIAFVKPEAHGFEIETPLMKVTDLGTEFGVIADNHRESQVHVFVGRVELAHAGASRLVEAGEAIVIRNDQLTAHVTRRDNFLDQYHFSAPLVARLQGGHHLRASEIVTYVDATPENTTVNAMTMVLEPTAGFNVGDGRGHLTDHLWSLRNYGNGGTIFTVHPNDGPVSDTLTTTVEGLEPGQYRVYAYMWSATTVAWDIAAGLAGAEPVRVRAGDIGTYAAARQVFADTTLTEAHPHAMWAVDLGTFHGTEFSVRVNILPGDDRTWYDGVGYARIEAEETQ